MGLAIVEIFTCALASSAILGGVAWVRTCQLQKEIDEQRGMLERLVTLMEKESK